MKLRILTALFAAMLALLPAVQANAQNTGSQEARKAKLEKEIAQINRQLKENKSKSNTALGDLTLVRKKISNRKALIEESDKEIKALSLQVEEKRREVDSMETRLDTMSFYYARLVRNAYKNRDSRVWYMYILASENLGQAFRRIGYLRDLSHQMNVQAERISAQRDSVEKERARLEVMKTEAQSLRAKRQMEVVSLQDEEKQSNALVSRLKSDRKKYEKDLAAKRKQVETLNREIARIIREATKTTSSGKGSGSKTTIDYALASEFAGNKGKLPWPADGPVVEKFGQHRHPVYTNVQMPFNNGIGISVSGGTPVKAVFDGTVKQIVVMPGYNKCVLVQHGNYFSFYCKLGDVRVKSGDKVKTGQIIGTVDGSSASPQLHFQIWKGTSPQDPELWLK